MSPRMSPTMQLPTIGVKYQVTFDDCCVAGSFTATLVAVDADDEFVYALEFDNGVSFTETQAVQLEQAEATA